MRQWFFLFGVATGLLAGPLAGQQPAVGASNEGGLGECLFPFREHIQRQPKQDAERCAQACAAYLSNAGEGLPANQLFDAQVAHIKFAFAAEQYDAVKERADALRAAAARDGFDDPYGIKANTAAVLSIFLMHRNGETETALAQVRDFTAATPEFLAGHILHENLAFQADELMEATAAMQQALRLQPSAGRFYDLGFLQDHLEQYEAARASALNALATTAESQRAAHLMLHVAKMESMLGNHDRAERIFSLLDQDIPAAERVAERKRLFRAFPAIADRNFNLVMDFTAQETLRLERAINQNAAGNLDAALAIIGNSYVRCGGKRCMELELAIARQQGDLKEIARLELRLQHATISVNRSVTDEWEANFMRGLPLTPLEHYHVPKKRVKKPKLKLKETEHGRMEATFTVQKASSYTDLMAQMRQRLERRLRKYRYTAYVIEGLEQGYSYKRPEYDFVEHEWRMTLSAFKGQPGGVAALAPWRLIDVTSPPGDAGAKGR